MFFIKKPGAYRLSYLGQNTFVRASCYVVLPRKCNRVYFNRHVSARPAAVQWQLTFTHSLFQGLVCFTSEDRAQGPHQSGGACYSSPGCVQSTALEHDRPSTTWMPPWRWGGPWSTWSHWVCGNRTYGERSWGLGCEVNAKSKCQHHWLQWHMEDHKFKSTLNDLLRPCLKNGCVWACRRQLSVEALAQPGRGWVSMSQNESMPREQLALPKP